MAGLTTVGDSLFEETLGWKGTTTPGGGPVRIGGGFRLPEADELMSRPDRCWQASGLAEQ